MNSKRKIVIAALAAIILVVILVSTRGFGLWNHDNGKLTLYGNVDIRSVDLGFRVGGRIGEIPVEEGTHVAAGQLLAVLDKRPIADRLAQAQAQLAVAQAGYAKARNGSRPQEIAQAEAQLAQQQANLARATEDYERRKPLVASGAVSQAQFDQTVAAWRAAQAQVKTASEALSLARQGPRREDIEAAAAQMKSVAAMRDGANTDLADTELRAPSAGTLLTRAREPGAIVQPGETVFTLTIDRPLRVRAYVAEPDLVRIRPGMKVLVNADGTSKTYHGAIGYISPQAEFTPKSVETENLRTDLVYRLRVIVTDPDDNLRQGQPVTVTVPDSPPPARDR